MKKGFTLAEILIVLMVIGVIATLTVPSMMKGVQDAQYKAGIKKAYNTITNLHSKMIAEGNQPIPGESLNHSQRKFFIEMLENLSVRDITTSNANTGTLPNTNSSCEVKYTLNGNNKTIGVNGGNCSIDLTKETALVRNHWITTEDGMSYTMITTGKSNNCLNKSQLLAIKDWGTMVNNSCVAFIIDVNSVNKKPNKIESQFNTLTSKTLDTLTGDQYYILIGKDGVVTGRKNEHVVARIIADIK